MKGDMVLLGNDALQSKQPTIPAEDTIRQTLTYATELERIV